jgi:hypothetical protein
MKIKIITLVLLFAILSPAGSYAKTYRSHPIKGYTVHYDFFTHKKH